MVNRSQLNININPELMTLLKENAIKSGKTISNFVTEAINSQIINNDSEKTIEDRISLIEQRINSLENNIPSKLSLNKKITPYTTVESENCNDFFKAVFHEEVKRKKYKSKKDAWNDFIAHIDCFDQWNDLYTLRLKEVLFIKDGDPLTSDEMNSLTKGKICPSPIRTGLINWINNGEKGCCNCSDETIPLQQTICEKGSKLLDEQYPF